MTNRLIPYNDSVSDTKIEVLEFAMEEMLVGNAPVIRPLSYAIPQHRLLNIGTEIVRDHVDRQKHGGRMNLYSMRTIDGLVLPSTRNEGSARKNGGWNEIFYRWKAKVKVINSFGRVTLYQMSGYTEPSNETKSYTGKLSPDIIFSVNRWSKVKRHEYQDDNLNESVVYDVKESQQVIRTTRDSRYDNEDALVLERPSDLAAAVETTYALNALDDVDQEDVTNGVTQIVDVTTSDSRWMRPSNILHHLADSYITAVEGDRGGNVEAAVWGQVSKLTEENDSIRENPFLQAVLRKRRGTKDMDVYGPEEFTLHELERIDPDVRVVCNGDVVDQSDRYEHWEGSDKTTVMATWFNHLLTQKMIEKGVSYVEFEISDYPTRNNGNYQVRSILKPEPTIHFDDESMLTIVPSTENQLELLAFDLRQWCETIVVPVISESGDISYQLIGSANIDGDTILTIGLDGERPVPFQSPTVCDSSYSPVLATDDFVDGMSRIQRSAYAAEVICNSVSEALSNHRDSMSRNKQIYLGNDSSRSSSRGGPAY